MLSSGITTALTSFIPIKLEDMDNVRLMDRVDTKYVTSVHKIPELLNHIDGEYKVLEINNSRLSTYHTTYLDSFDYIFFNQHVTGKLERNKVRYRTYESTGTTFLEIKKRTNKNRTVKWRIKNELTSENKCDEIASEFIRKYVPDWSVGLQPVLTNTFKRITLAGTGCGERITIDYDLSYQDFNGNLAGFPAIAIIEMKKEGYNCRSSFGDTLKGLSIHRQGFSKYCMGAGLFFDLPRKNILKQKFLLIKKIEDEYIRCAYS